MDYPMRCTICNERDHRLQKCPELYGAGSYSGGGEEGEHSHDDDEKVTSEVLNSNCPTPE